MHCVAFASMLVEMHHDARIDLDPILVFLCVAFLRLSVEKLLEKILEIFAFHKLTQCKALHHFVNRPLECSCVYYYYSSITEHIRNEL